MNDTRRTPTHSNKNLFIYSFQIQKKISYILIHILSDNKDNSMKYDTRSEHLKKKKINIPGGDLTDCTTPLLSYNYIFFSKPLVFFLTT